MMSFLRCSIAICLALLAPAGSLLCMDGGACVGQSGPDTGLSSRHIYVSFISSHRELSALQESTYYSVIREFANQGFIVSKDPDDDAVFVDAVEHDGLVALSFFFGEVLPENAVTLCKNAEVFYAGLPADKRARLPQEGKWLREMVSVEYMRQFIAPWDSRLVIVPRSEVGRAIAEVVREFRSVLVGRK
jgi:hypothetical protein